MSLRFAYNTNGAANHRLDDALALIAEAGYDGVALTLDHHHLDPFAPDLTRRSEKLARRLEELGLGVVIETGARFLLDPRAKHEPTLLSPEPEGRARRLDFLYRCVEVAAATSAEAVSFWAGVPRPGVDPTEAHRWLVEGVSRLAERAEERGVVVALEPEPGMLVETLDDYREVARQVAGLKLALDTGHCLVTGEREPDEAVREFAGELGTVAIEDMKRWVHEHLPFGYGDMNVPAVFTALDEVKFGGLVCVELSRESPQAHEAVPEAIALLKDAERGGECINHVVELEQLRRKYEWFKGVPFPKPRHGSGELRECAHQLIMHDSNIAGWVTQVVAGKPVPLERLVPDLILRRRLEEVTEYRSDDALAIEEYLRYMDILERLAAQARHAAAHAEWRAR